MTICQWRCTSVGNTCIGRLNPIGPCSQSSIYTSIIYIYQYIYQLYIAIYTSIAYIEILYNTLRGGEFPARARSLLQDDMSTALRALDQEHDTSIYSFCWALIQSNPILIVFISFFSSDLHAGHLHDKDGKKKHTRPTFSGEKHL